MPKILLSEPRAPNLYIFSQFPLPRLGVLILGTIMRSGRRPLRPEAQSDVGETQQDLP
jgi:hypothetical protein